MNAILFAVAKIGGVFPLLCTPYTEKGEVDYATLAKTVCLGNISALAGKGSVLAWDGHHVTNNAAADKFVTKEYRKGWDPFV